MQIRSKDTVVVITGKEPLLHARAHQTDGVYRRHLLRKAERIGQRVELAKRLLVQIQRHPAPHLFWPPYA